MFSPMSAPALASSSGGSATLWTAVSPCWSPVMRPPETVSVTRGAPDTLISHALSDRENWPDAPALRVSR